MEWIALRLRWLAEESYGIQKKEEAFVSDVRKSDVQVQLLMMASSFRR